MKIERIEEILRNFPSKRILVIGDVMLDEFMWGRVSRISPEAPVPVVDVVRESSFRALNTVVPVENDGESELISNSGSTLQTGLINSEEIHT